MANGYFSVYMDILGGLATDGVWVQGASEGESHRVGYIAEFKGFFQKSQGLNRRKKTP